MIVYKNIQKKSPQIIIWTCIAQENINYLTYHKIHVREELMTRFFIWRVYIITNEYEK